MGVELIVASVQESIDQGKAVEEKGPNPSRNMLQTVTLLDAVEKHTNLMRPLVGVEEMKKKPGPKSGFSHIAMNLGNGIPKTNDLSFGTYLMGKSILVNNSGYFL